MKIDIDSRGFLFFVVKMLVIFGMVYGLCYFVMSVSSSKGDYHLPFVEKYFNIIAWLRNSLMEGTSFVLRLSGFEVFYPNEYGIRNVDPKGRGIWIVYSCLGYGIMSFWIAFVWAHSLKFSKKFIWTILGLLIIWIINVIRLSMVFFSVNSNFKFPLFDHHTWFNIFAYLFIFLLMYVFTRKYDRSAESKEENERRSVEV